jgi:hypothetical protein
MYLGIKIKKKKKFLARRAGNELKRVNWFRNAKCILYLAQGMRNKKIIAEGNKPVSKKESKQMKFMSLWIAKEGKRMTYLWICPLVDSLKLPLAPFNSFRQRKRDRERERERESGVSVSVWFVFRSFLPSVQPVSRTRPVPGLGHTPPADARLFRHCSAAAAGPHWLAMACSRLSWRHLVCTSCCVCCVWCAVMSCIRRRGNSATGREQVMWLREINQCTLNLFPCHVGFEYDENTPLHNWRVNKYANSRDCRDDVRNALLCYGYPSVICYVRRSHVTAGLSGESIAVRLYCTFRDFEKGRKFCSNLIYNTNRCTSTHVVSNITLH